jgi:hypothetical protein
MYVPVRYRMCQEKMFHTWWNFLCVWILLSSFIKDDMTGPPTISVLQHTDDISQMSELFI